MTMANGHWLIILFVQLVIGRVSLVVLHHTSSENESADVSKTSITCRLVHSESALCLNHLVLRTQPTSAPVCLDRTLPSALRWLLCQGWEDWGRATFSICIIIWWQQ
jgi:hypothetical protein